MKNICFENIQFIINTALALTAVIFAGFGLTLWRRQLKGGDKYTYAKESLFELKKLLNFIEDYRYYFHTVQQENDLLVEIQKQFSVYESKIILIGILSNNKINDLICGKNMKSYLTTIYKSKNEKDYLIETHNGNYELSEEERKNITKKLLDLDKVLKIRNKEQDIFGDELNKYFDLMCERLKQIIK